MPHTNIDIGALELYNKDGRRIDLESVTGENGEAYLFGKVYFNELSVALYDNQNFYMLKKKQVSSKYYGGVIASSTDVVLRNCITSVSFPNDLKAGQVIRELPGTASPVPHIDYDAGGNGIGFSPVFIAEVEEQYGRIRMSVPALAAGAVDFETVGSEYVFPGENLGDKFSFKWKKQDGGETMQGWPYLNDEAHSVGDYRIYKNRLYKCVTAYAGPYVGNSSMWKEVSPNRDEYGFFVYDVLVDEQNSPYIEKTLNKEITYSYDHVGFKFPLEFNVAFNPYEETAYENTLEVYYTYADTGETVKIMELYVYGEGVMEDERLSTWLANFGIKFNRYDAMILKDYDLKEAMPDWVKINTAMKQMFFNKEQVFPYIGTYRGLASMIALLGFKDVLHVKEYWKNQNPQSVYFNKMLLVDISDMLDDGKINEMSVIEFNRVVKFDAAMKKTGFLALVYEFTKESGDYDSDGIPVVEETSGMTSSEVFYKLYRMRDKLKAEFLPVNVVIKDIIGEYLYFQKVTPKYWCDQTVIYGSQVAETAGISLFPSMPLYARSVESLYPRRHAGGAPFPAYSFSDAGADPFESGQRYQRDRSAGLVDAIRAYYGEIAEHDAFSISGNYYWECGDDGETPIGCPVILTFDVEKILLGETRGRRLSDFVVGDYGTSQSYFTATEHQAVVSPAQNQWSEVVVNGPVIFGHLYTHNINVNGVFNSYYYTAGAAVSVTADNAATEISITIGSNTTQYACGGSLTREEAASYITGLVNSSQAGVVATDNADGTFRIMSNSTDPFTVLAVYNCVIAGDTVDDVAYGMVQSILSGASPAVDAWVNTPVSGTYFVRALNFSDAYVNLFEADASYYTLGNVDYLNMYELEWTIKRVGGGQPYSFTWRGPLKDMLSIPHVLPYAGKYDVSVRAYDFNGGATMSYESGFITVLDGKPEIVALSRYEDKFNYQMSNLRDAMLQDCGSSEVYDPIVIMRNLGVESLNTRGMLMDWDFYRRGMYAYDINTDSGVMLWDTTLPVPDYLPWHSCGHPLKNDWGVNPEFNLTPQDFSGARLEDLYFWKLKNTVFNADFLAGFHMWNAAPFDMIFFDRTYGSPVGSPVSSPVGSPVGSPVANRLFYVCPQLVYADAATDSNVNLANVNTIDGVPLSAGSVVLVKNQADAVENGVYVSSPAGSHFSLSRHSQCDTAYKTANAFVIVSGGNAGVGTCWRTDNYSAAFGDSFADGGMAYHECPYSASYAPGSPFDYLQALSDIICSEKHPIIGLFSSHVILYGGSPETRMLHVTARNFDKQAYQYLTYIKNTSASLWPAVPAESITGSDYTFYEPSWAYSNSLMSSLESEYPNFRREELFMHAPIMDILNGFTNDIGYFISGGYVEIDGGRQVGHLPTALDENYLSVAKIKAFQEGHFIPKYSLLFFSINNLFAKRQFEWTLTDDVTGEELIRVTGVPFFAWKFNIAGTYRMSVSIQDKNGNMCESTLTSYVHVGNWIQYRADNERYNARRASDIALAGMMYGAEAVSVPPNPPAP